MRAGARRVAPWLRRNGTRSSRAGSALVVVLPVVMVMGTAGLALVSLTSTGSRADRGDQSDRQADRLAEASALRALSATQGALERGEPIPATAGTEAAPLVFGTGSGWATITDLGDGLLRIEAEGRTDRSAKRIEAIVEMPSSPLYDYAIFAGNRDGDPNYSLELSGTGDDSDEILGSIYSAGDLNVREDATVTGEARASGAVLGVSGTEGHTELDPDIAGMSYDINHDYDVASLFSGATPGDAPAGGTADQLPASSPAHIFRRNPSDRTHLTSTTSKDDYFLEDPYEPANRDADQDGSDPAPITLVGESGTDKTFYIDGNLWVDDRPSFSFRCENENGEPVRVTFVVRGNITFGDNLYYNDPENDAIAFIAIEDPLVPNSGNIMFGDQRAGTLNHMDAFMYAENNFVDYHLDQNGSKRVMIRGNMTAGNQVRIQRDFVQGDGSVSHSKLTIDFDDRISTGAVSLSGLPQVDLEEEPLRVRMWRHVTVDRKRATSDDGGQPDPPAGDNGGTGDGAMGGFNQG